MLPKENARSASATPEIKNSTAGPEMIFFHKTENRDFQIQGHIERILLTGDLVAKIGWPLLIEDALDERHWIGRLPTIAMDI